MKEEKREDKICDTCTYSDENGIPINLMCEMCIDNMNWRPKDEYLQKEIR